MFPRTCRRRLSDHQALLHKYLHLQYNVFESSPSETFHDKMSPKHSLTGEHLQQKRDSNKVASEKLY